jgi:hypothetical protein
MDQIDKKKFDSVKSKKEEEKRPEFVPELSPNVDDKTLSSLIEDMQHPVKAQQHLAVQIKTYLDDKIKKELAKDGTLTDHTRRWVETFNTILENIQKALYGDKTVNMHVHAVTHGDIAAKIREVIESDNSGRRNKRDGKSD